MCRAHGASDRRPACLGRRAPSGLPSSAAVVDDSGSVPECLAAELVAVEPVCWVPAG